MAEEQTIPSIALEACAQLVQAAARSCSAQPAAPPAAAGQALPNWDAMANAFASLSAALAWGAVVLAVIVVIAGFAWVKIVVAAAEKEAKEEAKRATDSYINRWLADEAPGIVRQHLALLIDTNLGPGDDAKAADAIGEKA